MFLFQISNIYKNKNSSKNKTLFLKMCACSHAGHCVAFHTISAAPTFGTHFRHVIIIKARKLSICQFVEVGSMHQHQILTSVDKAVDFIFILFLWLKPSKGHRKKAFYWNNSLVDTKIRQFFFVYFQFQNKYAFLWLKKNKNLIAKTVKFFKWTQIPAKYDTCIMYKVQMVWSGVDS